uniref:hypothetical protein n=1 Tax=Anaerocolumna xylanovorans TaxID=100134 RepID=UPI0038BAA408
TNFNTSHVLVLLYPLHCHHLNMQISIHLMFWFYYMLAYPLFNVLGISIHLMFWFYQPEHIRKE